MNEMHMLYGIDQKKKKKNGSGFLRNKITPLS